MNDDLPYQINTSGVKTELVEVIEDSDPVPGLTDRESMFVDAYLLTWSGARAIAKLGWSESGYYAMTGNRWLRKPRVRAEIERRMKMHVMSMAEVLARLSAQAQASFADFITFDVDTGQPQLDLHKAQENGSLHAIKELTFSGGTLSIKLHDSIRAMELLLRGYQIFAGALDKEKSLRFPDYDAAIEKAYGLPAPQEIDNSIDPGDGTNDSNQ